MILSDMPFLHKILETSLNFFHADFILENTASCTLPSVLKHSQGKRNHTQFLCYRHKMGLFYPDLSPTDLGISCYKIYCFLGFPEFQSIVCAASFMDLVTFLLTPFQFTEHWYSQLCAFKLFQLEENFCSLFSKIFQAFSYHALTVLRFCSFHMMSFLCRLISNHSFSNSHASSFLPTYHLPSLTVFSYSLFRSPSTA